MATCSDNYAAVLYNDSIIVIIEQSYSIDTFPSDAEGLVISLILIVNATCRAIHTCYYSVATCDNMLYINL